MVKGANQSAVGCLSVHKTGTCTYNASDHDYCHVVKWDIPSILIMKMFIEREHLTIENVERSWFMFMLILTSINEKVIGRKTLPSYQRTTSDLHYLFIHCVLNALFHLWSAWFLTSKQRGSPSYSLDIFRQLPSPFGVLWYIAEVKFLRCGQWPLGR